ALRGGGMTSATGEVPFWSDAEVAAAFPPALAQLEMRLVLAYPTETVYGFGGAIDRDSVDALIRLKGRPKGKPFLLLIADTEMLAKLDLSLPSFATNLAARHWPGPLTLVLPGGARDSRTVECGDLSRRTSGARWWNARAIGNLDRGGLHRSRSTSGPPRSH